MRFEQNRRKVVASFRDRASGARAFATKPMSWSVPTASIQLSGASFYPAEGEPASRGSCYGAPPSRPRLSWTATRMVIAGHFHQRIIVYPIGRAQSRAALLTNWICQIAVTGDAPPREDLEPACRRRDSTRGIRQLGGFPGSTCRR